MKVVKGISSARFIRTRVWAIALVSSLDCCCFDDRVSSVGMLHSFSRHVFLSEQALLAFKGALKKDLDATDESDSSDVETQPSPRRPSLGGSVKKSPKKKAGMATALPRHVWGNAQALARVSIHTLTHFISILWLFGGAYSFVAHRLI